MNIAGPLCEGVLQQPVDDINDMCVIGVRLLVAGAKVQQLEVTRHRDLLIGPADGLRQPVKLADTPLDVLRVCNHSLDRTLEYLRQSGFPTADVGLGAGDGNGMRIHGHGKNGVALGERVGHQWHHCCDIYLQRVDTQIRLLDTLGKPLGQGFQGRPMGGDALQRVLSVVGRRRR